MHTDTLLAEGFVVAVIFVNSCIQEPNCSLCFSFERHWNTAYTEFLFTGWILCPTMDGLRDETADAYSQAGAVRSRRALLACIISSRVRAQAA